MKIEKKNKQINIDERINWYTERIDKRKWKHLNLVPYLFEELLPYFNCIGVVVNWTNNLFTRRNCKRKWNHIRYIFYNWNLHLFALETAIGIVLFVVFVLFVMVLCLFKTWNLNSLFKTRKDNNSWFWVQRNFEFVYIK